MNTNISYKVIFQREKIKHVKKTRLGPYSRPLAQFFPIRTSRPANNIYIYYRILIIAVPSGQSGNKLQKIQDRAPRVITKLRAPTSLSILLSGKSCLFEVENRTSALVIYKQEQWAPDIKQFMILPGIIPSTPF